MKKLLLVMFITSIGVFAACGGANKYMICVMDPVHGKSVCNKTGDPKDNFDVTFDKMENFIALPPDDAKDIFRRLTVCEGGRKGG